MTHHRRQTAIAGPFRKRRMAQAVERELTGALARRPKEPTADWRIWSQVSKKEHAIPGWARGFAVKRIGFGAARPGATRRERWSIQWEVIATSWRSK